MEQIEKIKKLIFNNSLDVWEVEKHNEVFILFVREDFEISFEFEFIKKNFPDLNFQVKFLTRPE